MFVKGDKVYVVESKPLQSNGAIKLSPKNTTTGLPLQMSDEWVDDAILRLRAETGDAAKATATLVNSAKNQGKLVKLVIGANQNGIVVVKLK